MPPSKDRHGIAGLRILVAEDEMLVAMMLEDMLDDLGCTVVGPANRVPQALDLARQETFDGAVLDVNLAGQEIYPVAEALADRDIPFVFVTGYGSAGLRDPFCNVATLQKPFQPQDLEQVIRSAILGQPK